MPEVNWTAVAIFIVGQVIATIVGGTALYIAIRVDLARMNERINLGLEAMRERDSLILDRADDAHARIDEIFARFRKTTS